MQLEFCIPDPDSFISGGNIYNRHLLSALQNLGVTVRILSPAEINNRSDCPLVIDSIYFDHIVSTSGGIPGNSIGLIHHLPSLYPIDPKLFRTVEVPVLKRFDKLIATSVFTRDYLASGGYDEGNIVVLEPVPEPVERRAPNKGKLRALMLGSVEERKGALAFLKALRNAELPPDYEIRIVGNLQVSPGYARECLNLVRDDKNLSKTVSFLGSQDKKTIESLWARSNLFISASEMETFGMAIQEAVVRGIPCLVFRGGHTGAHVDEGINGMTAGTSVELVQHFEKLTGSAELFTELLNSANTFDNSYAGSWDLQASRLIKFLGLD